MGMWLAGLPTLMLWTIVILPAATLSLVGLHLVRRNTSPAAAKAYNDVVGFGHGIVGVVYAVLLGFTIIVSWEQFDAADRNVSEEASAIADLYNDNKLLVSTFRQLLLYRALNFTPPKFFHTQLVVNESGKRLAKRHGSLSLRALRERGVAAEELCARYDSNRRATAGE